MKPASPEDNPFVRSEGCSALVIALVLAFPIGALDGWVLSRLWAWFVVPFGAPQIGWAVGAGISLMLGLATYRARRSESGDATVPVVLDKFLNLAMADLMFLVVGAIFALFV